MPYEHENHRTDPVDLRPVELVGDVANAVLQYHAQGMDAMEEYVCPLTIGAGCAACVACCQLATCHRCAVASLPLSEEELQSLLQVTPVDTSVCCAWHTPDNCNGT